ncbi:MAG: hypothetical protein U1E97_00835 [Alphaproteobacteria bacterium]
MKPTEGPSTRSIAELLTSAPNSWESDAAGAMAKMREMGVKVTNLTLAEASEWRKKAPDFLKGAAGQSTRAAAPVIA